MSREAVEAAQEAFASQGPAITLGAVVHEGRCHPGPIVTIPLAMLNRHGLIAGATGTGKTKTLQLMAEQLSAAGVPVFLADIKGDVSGIAAPGEANDKITQRATDTGFVWRPAGHPVEFLSLTGQHGACSKRSPASASARRW
jgi:DNA helicase HerA-like ATPase